MSVSTQAILLGNPNAEEIAQAIKSIFGFEVNYYVPLKDDPSFVIMTFPEPNGNPKAEGRRLNVHFDSADFAEVNNSRATVVSLGCFGSAVEIVQSLAEKFGGFVCESDYVGDWRAVEPKIDTEEEAFAQPLDPIDEFNLALCKSVDLAAVVAIRDVIRKPDQFQALMQALDDYRAATQQSDYRP